MAIQLRKETSLHAALKKWYMLPGDLSEVDVDGYTIDIVRGELLVEIQTQNFSAIKNKIMDLSQRHLVRLVYPIPKEKWIVYKTREYFERRKSPKRGRLEDLFSELVSFPDLVRNPYFSIEVLLIGEEEHRCRIEKRCWTFKRWKVMDRFLLNVKEHIVFKSESDFLKLLPPNLQIPFTSLDLANSIHMPRYLAQKMIYCLRGIDVVDVVGKKRNAFLYAPSWKFLQRARELEKK
ncbi:MAG: hypothetical protein ACUVTL_09030 [Thermoproteota archaeon]